MEELLGIGFRGVRLVEWDGMGVPGVRAKLKWV